MTAFLLFLLLLLPFLIQKKVCRSIPESELYSRLGWWGILWGSLFWLDSFNLLLLVLGIFFLASLVDIGYAIFFRAILIPSSIEAVFLTNKKESKEFLGAYWDWQKFIWLLLFGLIQAVILILLSLSSYEKPPGLVETSLVFALLTYVLVSVVKGRFKGVLPGLLGILPTYLRDKRVTNKLIEKRRYLSETITEAVSMTASAPEVTVLVIGESASRRHHQLYGYPRETTPYISSIKEQLCVFEDVISNFSQTNPSLSYLLTQASLVKAENPDEALSLIDVAKQAGIETWWLSNQEPIKSTPMAIARCADVTYFAEIEGSGGDAYDEELLPVFYKALQSPAKHKLIVLHLMGSHLQYNARYPVAYRYFKSDDGVQAFDSRLPHPKMVSINEYDNSIRYTDALLNKVHQALHRDSSLSSLMVYFSDHGEEVYDTRDFKGHEPSNYSQPMFEVPFWMWASDSYKKDNLFIYDTLAERREQPLCLDDLYHTSLHLMGIETSVVEFDRSWASSNFQFETRLIYGKVYDEVYK